MQTKPLVFFFDFLRVIAAQTVVIFHILSLSSLETIDSSSFKDAASYSVIIFFLLSGFLISQSTRKKIVLEKYTFKKFFTTRFSRIYAGLLPALLFVLLADIVANVLFDLPIDNINPLQAFYNLTMLQEFPALDFIHYHTTGILSQITDANSFGSDLPLWTLSIEWWIYMLFGWLVTPLENKKSVTYYFILALIAVVPIYQLFVGSRMGPGITLFWIIGAIMGWTLDQFAAKNITLVLLAFCALFVMLCFHESNIFNVGMVISLLFCILVLQIKRSSKLINKSVITNQIKVLASFSFTLYLTHFPIIRILDQALYEYNVFIQLTAGVLLSNLLAYAISRIMEVKYKAFSKFLSLKFPSIFEA